MEQNGRAACVAYSGNSRRRRRVFSIAFTHTLPRFRQVIAWGPVSTRGLWRNWGSPCGKVMLGDAPLSWMNEWLTIVFIKKSTDAPLLGRLVMQSKRWQDKKIKVRAIVIQHMVNKIIHSSMLLIFRRKLEIMHPGTSNAVATHTNFLVRGFNGHLLASRQKNLVRGNRKISWIRCSMLQLMLKRNPEKCYGENSRHCELKPCCHVQLNICKTLHNTSACKKCSYLN